MPPVSRPPSGIYPVSFFQGNVFAAFSGREYSRDRFEEFLANAGLSPGALVRPKQVHGNEILWMDCPPNAEPGREADGIMTAASGAVLGILTADCIPAFFWDPVKKAAGLAHAGWKGLKAGILEKMIARMKTSFGSNPETIQIAFGPFIRACCYEVGREFSGYFPAHYRPDSPEKGHVDLASAARERLTGEGILPANLQDSGICTSCSQHAFFSARRGDASERILSVIHIRS